MAIEWNFSLVNKDRYIILVKHELGEGRGAGVGAYITSLDYTISGLC